MMKLNDLMGLVTIALEENTKDFGTWFINFSGHVNTLDMTFYLTGWKEKNHDINQKCRVELDKNGIQEAYWFIKNRLRK